MKESDENLGGNSGSASELFGKCLNFIQKTSNFSRDEWNLVASRSSSATELISRRGVFSRRHYGSVDQFPQPEMDGSEQNCRQFRIENGETLAEKDEVFGSPSTPILENPEYQTRWYFKYFLGKLHQNYVGIDLDKHPYFLSIVSLESGNKCMPMYRAMLFKKEGTQKIVLPYSLNSKLTVKQLLSHFTNMDCVKNPKEIFSADIQKDLLLLEEQEGSVNFKFGVIFMKRGQKVDDEMLSNEYGSQCFEEFLGVLGEKIKLKGWEHYRGGLDIKGDMTGKYSVYTMYEGHEIMFHVSTLLPFSRDNRQQVERKRHIGNDIVNIVFIDDCDDDEHGEEFDPNCIKSQFTHIFAVVTKRGRTYRIAMHVDETVPPFGPTLPNPPEFTDPVVFREFLLVKLINGEKAAFQTPTFAQKRERTLEMLIKDLYEEYAHDTKTAMLNRRAFSEVLYDAPRTSKLKEEARQVEFVRIGQALKLEAIVRGDAPTSLASAGPGSMFKRPPWEPQCFYANFYHRGPIYGDSFGHDSLFLATDEGTFHIKEDQTHSLIFDKSLSIKQLTVVEDHGILLARGGSFTHKEGHRVHVFRLNEFHDDKSVVRTRIEVKDRRIDRTRGCHLYTTAKGSDGHLRMSVAIGKKVQIFQWKHTAAWTSWCPTIDHDTVDGFLFIREIQLHDSPTIMTILETPVNTRTKIGMGIMVCVGYKHHFEIVSEQTGLSTKLHEADTGKRSQTHLVGALELCDGQETELLLCYNHTCHFQKLMENPSNTSDFDFQWNTSPTSIVCAFPYIIAFTSDTMEIRLLVNGNLVHTVTMAELQLITSKRDIYFATTAPEFIPKDLRLRWSETDNNGDSPIKVRPKITEVDRIADIKQKCIKLNEENDGKDEKEIHSTTVINFIDPILNNSLNVSGTSPIHRVGSLQNRKDRDTEAKRSQLSKSNSCGDGTPISQQGVLEGELGLISKPLQALAAPPNSPKILTKLFEGNDSPSKHNQRKNSKSRSCGDSDTESSPSPERKKPLRIYRIPLTNLTGAHHSHAYNPHSRKSANNNHHLAHEKHHHHHPPPPNKIVEDSMEGTLEDLTLPDDENFSGKIQKITEQDHEIQ